MVGTSESDIGNGRVRDPRAMSSKNEIIRIVSS
jgi:hypothetical protein